MNKLVMGSFLLCLHFFVLSKTVSLIVPCHWKHAKYLPELLQRYEKQTVVPDEVVIAASEINKGDTYQIIHMIKNKKWTFPVQIVENTKAFTAGQNRNIACNHAQGDIFICQDADDIPHPQRIEIICYFFEKYEVDHLEHRWSQEGHWSTIDKLSEIQPIFLAYFSHYVHANHYHQGVPAISRSLFSKIQWGNERRRQDTHFNEEVYKILPKEKRLLIPLILYQYRPKLSTLVKDRKSVV